MSSTVPKILFVLAVASLNLTFVVLSWAEGDEACLSCHGDPELVDTKGRSLYVVPERYGLSVHGNRESGCVGCHVDLEGLKEFPHPEELEEVNCGSCHKEVFREYEKSIHGVARIQEGVSEAASCADCHSKHEIQGEESPSSWVHPLNLPRTCGKCHMDEEIVSRFRLGEVRTIKSYLESVHGRALKEKGLTVSAVCNDCHGTHDIRLVSDTTSMVWKGRVPETCGSCHGGIYALYGESIHGKELAKGNRDVPACTDCHGEHTIYSPEDPQSKVYSANIPGTCTNCHDDERLTTKYGLPSRRLTTYGGSYHGTALRLGDVTVANCASCHGTHEILPSTDPRSSIYPENLHLTCGKCHPRAGVNFAKGKIHVDDTKESNVGVYVARQFYKFAITGLVSAFLGLIVLDLWAKKRKRNRKDS